MKFTGCIPLIATAMVDIEAEDEDEAMDILLAMYDRNEIDLNGYDNESVDFWWIEEGQ